MGGSGRRDVEKSVAQTEENLYWEMQGEPPCYEFQRIIRNEYRVVPRQKGRQKGTPSQLF